MYLFISIDCIRNFSVLHLSSIDTTCEYLGSILWIDELHWPYCDGNSQMALLIGLPLTNETIMLQLVGKFMF